VVVISLLFAHFISITIAAVACSITIAAVACSAPACLFLLRCASYGVDHRFASVCIRRRSQNIIRCASLALISDSSSSLLAQPRQCSTLREISAFNTAVIAIASTTATSTGVA
jgi:hypothetical protein